MNKQRRLKAARDYALAIALHKVPTPEQEAALKEAGKISRDGYVFHFTDAEGAEYVLVPPRNGRRRVVAYTAKDYETFKRYDRTLAQAVTRAEYDAVQAGLEGLPASLASSLQEGLDTAYRQGEMPEEDGPEAKLYGMLSSGLAGVSFAWKGSNIWATGDTKPHRDELKAAGFRWSRKRGAWWRSMERREAQPIPEALEDVSRRIAANGLAGKWSGLCLWVEATRPLTEADANELKRLGASFSRKRGQWYFRAA